MKGVVSFTSVAFDEGVGGNTYRVLVDDKKYFTIFGDQMDSLTDGARYRFHYMDIAVGKAIFSVERAET